MHARPTAQLTTRTPSATVPATPLDTAMSDPESTDPEAVEPTGDDEAAAAAEATDPARFDDALSELEQLVETLEQGDLSLEQSLEHFERGVGLARECRASLTAAEQKVQILLARDGDDNGDGTLDDFDPDSDAQ